MKDYYQILRVRQGASSPEIKRAYRVLVQQLHPDVNPDPAAHELIKEVNEAYDVLSDDVKRRDYDYRFDNPYVTVEVPQEPVHRDPYFKRQGRPATARNVEKSESTQLMEKSLYYFQWFFKFSAGLCIILLVDFCVPKHVSEEQMAEMYEIRDGRGRRKSIQLLVTNTGREITIQNKDARFILVEPDLQIYESRILSIETKIQTRSGSLVVTNLGTIYNNFLFLPIMLSIGSVIGLVVKKGTLDFKFSLGLVILVLLGITIKMIL